MLRGSVPIGRFSGTTVRAHWSAVAIAAMLGVALIPTVGVVVGLLGILYGGLGVAQAGQNAMNVVLAVPRNRRPNPLKSRGKSLLLLLTVGLGVVATGTSLALDAMSRMAGRDGARVGGASP